MRLRSSTGVEAGESWLPSGQAETESFQDLRGSGSWPVVDPVGASPTEIEIQYFQVCGFHVRFYSEGVASHSPGLPRFAATLGERFKRLTYPERVPSFVNSSNATSLNTTRNTLGLNDAIACLSEWHNPVGVACGGRPGPRVAAMRGNHGLCDATPLE